MDEIQHLAMDYLAYKNRLKIAQWEERLWQRHLQGAPCDVRPDEDRQRYSALLERIEHCRSLIRSRRQSCRD